MSSQTLVARILSSGALVLVASLVPVLISSPTARGADDPVKLRVGYFGEVDSFNPFLGIELTSHEAWSLTWDRLTEYPIGDITDEPEPALATSWEESDDGLTWTFKLREDVDFSDGEQLTSADVKTTLDRIIDRGPEATNWKPYIGRRTKVEVLDDYTFRLKLARPNSSLPLLPMPILPEHIWKDISEDEVVGYAAEPEDGQPVVGSGPFRFVEGSAGGSIYRFEANKSYWDGAPSVDEIEFKVFKNTDLMVQALKKGDVDLVDGLNPPQVKQLQSEPNIEAVNANGFQFDYTGAVDLETREPIGDGNPVLRDPKFRRALGYAINREQLVEKVHYDTAIAGASFIPPSMPKWRWDPSADEAFTFDLKKADELLDSAGYQRGPNGLRTRPDGEPIGTLRLLARKDSQTSKKTMGYLKEWLGELDIASEVKVVEENTLYDFQSTGGGKVGNYDIFEWFWTHEGDPNFILAVPTCQQRGLTSDTWYCNARYDNLNVAQRGETDSSARVALIKQMQQIIYEDSPWLVTTYSTFGQAVRTDRFACLRSQPDPGGLLLLQLGVYNYKNMRPAAEAGDCGGVHNATTASASGESDGPERRTILGAGVVALLGVGTGGYLIVRRRASSRDRE
jgi:peptide/nickel transport system substrate-binding protein